MKFVRNITKHPKIYGGGLRKKPLCGDDKKKHITKQKKEIK